MLQTIAVEVVLIIAAACAGHPMSTRMSFELAANSTLDGVPTAASHLEVSRNDARVFITRTNTSSPLTEGFGIRGADGSYDVVFSRPKRADLELLVVHADGNWVRIFGNERDTVAIRGDIRGDDLALDGPGLEHAMVNPAATLFDGKQMHRVVVARFGTDVGVGWKGDELALGRYDFEHGLATTTGPSPHAGSLQ